MAVLIVSVIDRALLGFAVEECAQVVLGVRNHLRACVANFNRLHLAAVPMLGEHLLRYRDDYATLAAVWEALETHLGQLLVILLGRISEGLRNLAGKRSPCPSLSH